MNPKDPRYAHLIGKHVIRPLPIQIPREQKLIPIIGDEHVDFEFGTGVLKVTPAHDKADFEIGVRHKLPVVDIMNPNGTMNALAGESLVGLDRFEARDVATEHLRELRVLEKEEPYTNSVGFSERADVPIEPRLSEQWFLKYPSVENARNCVEQQDKGLGGTGDSPVQDGNLPSGGGQVARRTGQWPVPPGKMKFHPDRWAKVYDHWMGGLQDWCVSRQLWWGHRIPVWRKRLAREFESTTAFKDVFHFAWALNGEFGKQNVQVQRIEDGKIFSGEEFWKSNGTISGSEFEFIICGDFGPKAIEWLAGELYGFTQDPDVLDTWFSSWLWPFATMGWPEQTETLKKFYPTTDLVTGPDIIFFWVARMIMAGYEFMGELPFKNVYFTGIIRDKQGRKMSKSLGNSPDPLDLIAKFGADALRFGVMRAAPLGQDILFDEQNVELGRNFCNKLWNACRFRQMQDGGDASSPARAEGGAGTFCDGGVAATFEVQGEIERTLLSSDDKWILLKLDAAIREVTIALNEYKFSDATATLYRFFWSEYCDWYVEASKAVLHGSDAARKANTLAVIDFVLSHTLRLFHPFLPFITEELWHGMGYSADMPENQGGQTIMFAPWPKPLDDDFKGHYGLDDCYLEIAGAKYELVSQGRNLRREANISAAKKIRYVLKPANFLPPHDIEVIRLLLNAEAVEVNENYQPAKGTLTARTELGELFLPLEGLRSADDLAVEKARLTRELEKIEAEISKVEQKLANPNFTQKVPPPVLREHQQRHAEWLAKRQQVQAALDVMSG